MLKLRLYITGKTPPSQRALDNLRAICETDIQGPYEIEVIDVLEHPTLAEHDKILATPTLVKQVPGPVRKIIGDLSDKNEVLLGLGLERLDQQVDEKALPLSEPSADPPPDTG